MLNSPALNSPAATSVQARARPSPLGGNCQQVAGPILAQQPRIGERAGGQGADDGPLPRPGVILLFLALLADGHPIALGQQPGQVGVDRLAAEAAERDGRGAAAGTLLGQLEAKGVGNHLGIVEEGLVEGADPEEQDHAGVVVAQAQVLGDHLAVLLP